MHSIALLVQDRLGDALFHTPALSWLRKTFPDTRIDVIAASPLAYQIFCTNRNCDKVVMLEELFGASESPYNVIVSMPNNKHAETIAERLATEVCTSKLPVDGLHRVESVTAHIIDAMGGRLDKTVSIAYQFTPSKVDLKNAQSLLGSTPVSELRIGCHVGCHGMAKRSALSFGKGPHKKVWPVSTYKRLIRLLHQKIPGSQIVLTGSKNEVRYSKRLRQSGVLDLSGKTNVGELASIIGNCDIYVSPDTGSLHLACTTNTVVAGLYGPTDPAIYGPWPGHDRSYIFSAPTVADISAGEVADYITEWFEQNQSIRPGALN